MSSQSSYEFAAGTICITPEENVPLAGYPLRCSRFSKVADPLEANAVLLKSDSNKIVMVSADLLFPSKKLKDGIIKNVNDLLQEEELFIAATHTHFAPATDETKPKLGKLNQKYLDFVIEKISWLIRDLLTGPIENVSIYYKVGIDTNSNINRRRNAPKIVPPPKKEISNLPDLSENKDSFIRIIQIVNVSGNTKAIIWNYSCHPTGYPDSLCVSADFPGFIRSMIRSHFDLKIPVLFFQGFSGNVNPAPFEKMPNRILGIASMNYLVFRILYGIVFGKSLEKEWKDWASSLGLSVINIIEEKTVHTINGSIQNKRASISLPELGLIGPENSLSFHSISLDRIKIIGISAEVVSEYVPIFKKIFSEFQIIPVGCIDHVFGYLPTNLMLREGGYEVKNFMPLFGIKGKFNDDFQEKIEEVVKSL